MDKSWSQVAGQAALLIALGGAVGLFNNLLAGETRRVEWVTEYADKPPREPAAPEPDAEAGGAGASMVSPGTDFWSKLDDVQIPALDPDQAAVDIDARQAAKLHGMGTLFIDARRTFQFEEGHIEGARLISVFETATLDKKLELLPFLLEPDAPLVVYCSGHDCPDSHMLAERLWGEGFINVLVYQAGYPNWLEIGGPIATGQAS